MKPHERIIVALDVATPDEAIGLVRALRPHVGCFKIGLQFITAMLKSVIITTEREAISNLTDIRILFAELQDNIFWDGKFNDIPNTIAGASKEIGSMGIKFFNVHASAGLKAMQSAVANKGQSKVLAVTVLTSLQCKDVWDIGYPKWPTTEQWECQLDGYRSRYIPDLVFNMVNLAKQAGIDGIICSPQELKTIAPLDGLIKVTPGVRPEWAVAGDQKRVMTPGEAIIAGADYLVIGRPITKPPVEIGGPVEAAKKIVEEIAQAQKEV